MIYVFLINSLVVAICVILHYEFLYQLILFIPKMKINHRYRIVIAVFGALVAHALEIWIFAISYYVMHKVDGWGSLKGSFDGSLMDCAYFSFAVFTTLGASEIQPIGELKYLTGIESLTGLVLITLTASFLFYEMLKLWESVNKDNV